MKLVPCAWIPAEFDGAGGSSDVPTIHRYGNGYAVRVYTRRLSLSGTWDHEPQPSSRTDEWIEEHTFPSLEAAGAALSVAPDRWRPHAQEAHRRVQQAEEWPSWVGGRRRLSGTS